jgi:hypothetical protein
LYLPGSECLARLSAPSGAAAGSDTTVAAVPDGSAPEPSAPSYRPLDPGTTISPDVLDPKAPLPTVQLGVLVYDCARGLPKPPAPTTTVAPEAPPVEAPPSSGG